MFWVAVGALLVVQLAQLAVLVAVVRRPQIHVHRSNVPIGRAVRRAMRREIDDQEILNQQKGRVS